MNPSLLLVTLALPMLAQVHTGDLIATVKDPGGKVLDTAQVRLERQSTGFARVAESGESGSYSFLLIPPNTDYRLTVSAPGYVDRTVENIRIALGETLNLEVELSAAAATFSASATSTAIESLDPKHTQLANILELQSIDNLPINRRNYLDFALLTPGVAETAVIGDGNDFRVGAPSEISFSGSNGRNGIFSIDGIAIGASGGNVRPSLPQNAVQEFQVSRNNHPAEIGFASGGAVNIVSRSGSNTLHGSLFGFLRHRSIQARNFFDPGRSPYTRVQSGANLGGPLRRDKTFFFAAYERLDRHEAVFVPLLTSRAALDSLSPSQSALLQFLGQLEAFRPLAGALNFALIPSNNPQVNPLFRRNSGSFPFSAKVNQGSFRLDHSLTAKHALFLRFNITRQITDNTRFGSLDGWSSGSSVENSDQTFVTSHTWTISPRSIFLLRFGLGQTRDASVPNDPIGPNILISGAGNFGRNVFLPNETRERYWQFHPQFTHLQSRHQWKFGMDLNWIPTKAQVSTYFGGRFTFGQAIPLGAVIDSAAGVPNLSAQLAATLVAFGQAPLAGALAEPISSLQSFALGLPLLFQMGAGSTTADATRSHYGFYAEDSWRPHKTLSLNLGLRFQKLAPAWVESRYTFAPRFGLAWSPSRLPRTVLRAGYGIYHDTIVATMTFSHRQFTRQDLNLILIPITGVPILNPATRAPVTSVDVWQNLLRKNVLGNRPISGQDLADVGIPANFQFPITGAIDPSYRTPNSQQAHVALDQTWGGLLSTLSLEASRSRHLFRIIDTNQTVAGLQPNGLPRLAPRNPALVSYFNHETTANAWFWAANIRVERRFRRNFGFAAFYTLSRAMDDSTDYFLDYQPMNPLDKRAETAPSVYDQRHRFVLYGTATSSSSSRWLGGWQFSPIFRTNSGRPFNVLSGVDSVGDGLTSNDRPIGLGRNAGRLPAFAAFDLRLSRAVKLSERTRLEFIGEIFNVANQTNFNSVNNVVGPVPASALPKPLTGFAGIATQPLAFTSASDPRQFQLGLKIAF